MRRFSTVPEGSPHNRYKNNLIGRGHNNKRRQRELGCTDLFETCGTNRATVAGAVP
jgi:hypothetical protein